VMHCGCLAVSLFFERTVQYNCKNKSLQTVI
jgi:hypothetical protein